jgi:hypothetical protein
MLKYNGNLPSSDNTAMLVVLLCTPRMNLQNFKCIFSLYFNIIKCMLLYWYRLKNLGKEFPLLKEAYNETKLLYLSKKPTWYESINIIVP